MRASIFSLRVFVLCAVFAVWHVPATAADWSNTSVWLLRGKTFELGPQERTILRVEHADAWAYGDNYFFFDMNQVDDTGTNIYGELSPRFSLGKISGHDFKWGPVKDVLISTSINAGNNFRAYLYGAAVDFDLPGFTYLQLNAYVRNDANQPGQTWQITPVWLIPFALGPAKMNFQGFIDFAGAEGATSSSIAAFPRLWLDVGEFWGAPGHVEVGVEYIYWKNKFGVEGITERVIEPMVRWTF